MPADRALWRLWPLPVGVALAAGALLLLPDPNAITPQRLLPPSMLHPLGTDPLGRDVAARLIAAAPVSLGLALAGLGGAMLLALSSALPAAWLARRPAGRAIDGASQALLSFPPLWLPLVVLALLGRGPGALVLCCALVLWADLHWLLRGEVQRVLAEPYVECARSLGFTGRQLLTRDVLPNLVRPCVWLALIKLRAAVVLLATLAFLGLGLPPPAPSWGGMIAESRDWFLDAPWLLGAPAAAIALTLLLASAAAGRFGRVGPQPP